MRILKSDLMFSIIKLTKTKGDLTGEGPKNKKM